MDNTIHRHDEGGPTATVTCEDGGATAAWKAPVGNILLDHPELNTGGYVYFTFDSEPTNVIKDDSATDFSGGVFTVPADIVTHLQIADAGVLYRAHVLLAYEDGRTWHNDTQFTCEAAPVAAPITELPYTGIEGGLVFAAVLLIGVGIAAITGSNLWIRSHVTGSSLFN